ncbi:hypothetical protein [Vulcanisaeta sp. JCM 16159]|uniref:hypothetical protein n=1 Tax=Vulcanisaeta sp. JCM 16159 TaxID=1295371 RepID=UPI0006CF520C|nr:hypothetical protein [Vulcanisaeta sp. JCM 16159]
MINIVLTPPGIEYIKYLREVAYHYDTFIAEVPNVEGVRRYLNGEIDFNQLLYEIEYFDVDYSREFYGMLRGLINNGINVVPIDPYGSISMRIRVRAILNDLGHVSLSNEEGYIAFIELRIAEAYRGYNSALLRGSFEDAVRYVLRYARLDAERIKFRSELRAREIVKLLRSLNGHHDVLIHADHYNEVLMDYLSRKLMCKPGVIRLGDAVSKRLGIRPWAHPGVRLTNNYVYEVSMDKNGEYLLASRALIYALLKVRVFRRVDRGVLGDRAILIDSSLMRLAYGLSIDDARGIFRKLVMPRNMFRIRV